MYENDELKAIFTSAGRIIPFDNNGSIVYKFEYNLQDHLGNTRVVFSGHSNGQPEVMQVTDYYPFGLVMNQQNYFASGVLTNKYLYNGKELQDDELAGNSLGWYDYGFRFYDATLARFTTLDPLTEKNHSQSGFAYAYNNPVRFIDFMGLDTVDINHNDDNLWEITNTQIVEGDDIFRVTRDGETTTHTFFEGEYGERVNMLNLENTDDYALGVYHVSGADKESGRTGYFVTPGGEASTDVGSGARLPADTYNLVAPHKSASWQQIGVSHQTNGDVAQRGIRFHHGYGFVTTNGFTEGCFILSRRYILNNNNVYINHSDSRIATMWMDSHLGATSVYRYATQKYKGAGRIGALFNTANLTHQLILKDGF